MTAQPARRADYCAIACAEAFRGDGELLVSPMAPIPALGARFAQASFEPLLVLSEDAQLTYKRVFDVVWWGRRHVMMGASQIDRFGNQNISCIGPHAQPKVMLLGVRGAPGNTINHATSYWVGRHNRRIFVPQVSMVSGIGTDKARALGDGGRFFDLRVVVTNLGVFDFNTDDGGMRARSLHPGVTAQAVAEATGFDVQSLDAAPTTAAPTAEQLALLAALDPQGKRFKRVPDPE